MNGAVRHQAMLLRLGTSGTWSTWGSNLCNLGNLGLMHQPQPHEVGKGSKVCVSTLEGWKMVKLGMVHRGWSSWARFTELGQG